MPLRTGARPAGGGRAAGEAGEGGARGGHRADYGDAGGSAGAQRLHQAADGGVGEDQSAPPGAADEPQRRRCAGGAGDVAADFVEARRGGGSVRRARLHETAAGLTSAAATSPAQTNPTISVVMYAAVYASGKPYQFQ